MILHVIFFLHFEILSVASYIGLISLEFTFFLFDFLKLVREQNGIMSYAEVFIYI